MFLLILFYTNNKYIGGDYTCWQVWISNYEDCSLFNIFYIIVNLSDFRLSVLFHCLIFEKQRNKPWLTLIGSILQILTRKCQLTFLIPRKVLSFYQHIYSNKLKTAPQSCSSFILLWQGWVKIVTQT